MNTANRDVRKPPPDHACYSGSCTFKRQNAQSGANDGDGRRTDMERNGSGPGSGQGADGEETTIEVMLGKLDGGLARLGPLATA